MKGWMLALVLAATLALTAAAHKKAVKKAHADSDKKHIAEIEKKLHELMDELEEIPESEENEVVEEEEEAEEQAEEAEEQQEEEEEELEEIYTDPCGDMYCPSGRMCVVTDEGEGECRCVNTCDPEVDPRRRVCSNQNETWMSDCEMFRQRCLCEEGDTSCRSPDYATAHIAYYGECQEPPECQPEELEDFPRRLSEWLFNVMREMAERHQLSDHYVRLEREAEENPTKQWTYAVVWKWCQLDSHPKDSAVSRHELFPIRAPLYTMEHCISQFLDACDVDNDQSITLKEWAKCTKLSEEEVENLTNFCEDLHEE